MSGRRPPVLPAGCRHEKAHIFDLNFVDPCGVLTQMIALLRELITARTIHSKYMDSKVAHNTAQRFNTEVRHTAVQHEVYSPNHVRSGILQRPVHRRSMELSRFTPVGASCFVPPRAPF